MIITFAGLMNAVMSVVALNRIFNAFVLRR